MPEVYRESRHQFRLRVKGEGRWHEAVAFREGLKKKGASPAEAFEKTVAAFQPLDGAQAEPSRPKWRKRAAVGREKRAHKVRWRADLEWVYQHLGGEDVPRGAPSAGAEVLLAEARKHPWEFLTFAMSRMVPAAKGAEDAPKDELTGQDALELCQKWLKEYQEGQATIALNDGNLGAYGNSLAKMPIKANGEPPLGVAESKGLADAVTPAREGAWVGA